MFDVCSIYSCVPYAYIAVDVFLNYIAAEGTIKITFSLFQSINSLFASKWTKFPDRLRDFLSFFLSFFFSLCRFCFLLFSVIAHWTNVLLGITPFRINREKSCISKICYFRTEQMQKKNPAKDAVLPVENFLHSVVRSNYDILSSEKSLLRKYSRSSSSTITMHERTMEIKTNCQDSIMKFSAQRRRKSMQWRRTCWKKTASFAIERWRPRDFILFCITNHFGADSFRSFPTRLFRHINLSWVLSQQLLFNKIFRENAHVLYLNSKISNFGFYFCPFFVRYPVLAVCTYVHVCIGLWFHYKLRNS